MFKRKIIAWSIEVQVAFGMAGLGSAVLGLVADKMSIEFVYSIVPYFPLVGLIAYFLPNLNKKKP